VPTDSTFVTFNKIIHLVSRDTIACKLFLCPLGQDRGRERHFDKPGSGSAGGPAQRHQDARQQDSLYPGYIHDNLDPDPVGSWPGRIRNNRSYTF
jgi:hypothetical protein